MAVIPAGRFLMGSPAGRTGQDTDEGPQRWVDLSRFAMGRNEVTQGKWLAVMRSNPSRVSACGMNYPGENVSWNGAQEYVRRLSQRTGQNCRLPTEAEREYAAGAGSTTAYPMGERARRDHANYRTDTCCSGRDEGSDRWVETTHGSQFLVNAFEWGQDV